MKVKSYRALYHIFSYLSDKTNGASLFVKYKLALGIVLVGLTTVSCSKEEEEEPTLMCYDPVTVPQESTIRNKDNTEIIYIVEEAAVPPTEVSEVN